MGEDTMMAKIYNWSSVLLGLLFLFMAGYFLVFKGLGTHFASNSYVERVANMKGKVIGFDGKLLAIEFEEDFIKDSGDTQISSFLVSSDGASIQLKPVIIPEKKAKELGGTKTLVFPVSDILSLLEPKVYAVEVFVSNSKYAVSSVSLPLIPLDLTSTNQEEKHEHV